ncbi:hypothetical protein EHI8A_006430 [Entamoeba histolytica HM-1:IMSS-B]|uniref:Uncharacterized protein n=6 Tax=Entamoeba histolytica TaxID=5759 RepID=C4LSC1_ENTH1|nr:hypothetical protein, conserved [Entamoeba histolytica HM-1:IMSS]EMD45284.1 Hypothetical protein EHI5A_018810 [Entamoeba histolytica KU27]EMH74404.1 hypothetical protein EHI8A_006430 [Entamoeba histolytica HM-1:IMSS-B]EMS17382.1 hypothetical protein KM1_019450 [Entamoeba histolytica HM-3:IMSS]ENY63974.1 hypothetical protein EHI7A_007190 [Entamoeba histolytica HM-1:IMSS-A]GAT91586.1 hypothetical protein conserved [Entamoeba histolytica]|eukprot:XP_656385.1 hypothetical protein, conserved [Entamoeba histolytica HM-1:IMSS]
MKKESENNNILTSIILRSIGITSKYAGEFYCYKKNAEPEIIEMIKDKYGLSDDYLTKTKALFQVLNDSLIDKITWWAGRLFFNEFEMLMKVLKESNENSGQFLLQNSTKIGLTQTQIVTLKKVFKIKEEEQLEYDEEKEVLKNTVKELQNTIQLNNKRIEELQYIIENSANKTKELQQQIDDLTITIKEIKRTTHSKDKSQENIIMEKDKEIKKLKIELNEIKGEETYKTEIKSLKQTINLLKIEIEKYDKENEELDMMLRKSEKEVDEKEQEVIKMKEKIDNIDKIKKELEETKFALITKEEETNKKILEYKEENNDMNEIKKLLKKTQNEKKVLEYEIIKLRKQIKSEINHSDSKTEQLNQSFTSVKEKMKLFEQLCEQGEVREEHKQVKGRTSETVLSNQKIIIQKPRYTLSGKS